MNFNKTIRNINPEKVKELEQIITNKLDILTLLTEYGVDIGDGIRMTSPFGEDLAPSFFVNKEKQLWNDFSQSWGGGFVALYVKLNIVLKGRKLKYYDALEEILKRYPIVRQEFTGSLYTLDNISIMAMKSPEELVDHFNSRKVDISKIDMSKNKWFRAEKIKRGNNKQEILQFCIELQNSSIEWERQKKMQDKASVTDKSKKDLSASQELVRLANSFDVSYINSTDNSNIQNVSLEDLVIE